MNGIIKNSSSQKYMGCFSFPFQMLYNILMNKNTKPLKYIFKNHFHSFWKSNKYKFPKITHDSIWNNVNRFLDCGDIAHGYTAFKCEKCTHTHITPFSCKSRFCPSCGKIYAENWALNIKDQLINATHIHATFSLPKGFVRNHRHKLKNLAHAAYEALQYSFRKLGVLSFGAIINIHTFGRDTNWNPHIHCVFTLGGFDKFSNWKNINSLSYTLLRKSWQRCSLKIIQNFANKTKNTNLNNKISLYYHEYKDGFYVNANQKINNSFEICKYIGRYLARPAISEYRILKITESHVTFWYQNPDSKDKISLTLTTNQFIGRLLSHIPLKNFKMIRRFGLYARRTKNKMPKKNKLFKANLSWAERIFKTFGTNPLICPNCGSTLILLEIYHIKYGVIFPKNGFS